MIIYKTTNLINKKIYVGKDINNDPDYLGSGLLLKKSIEKYGPANFKKDILEHCRDHRELSKAEIKWIKKLNAMKEGYNIAFGGCGGDCVTGRTKEEKIIRSLKISRAHKGKTLSKECRRKISRANKGRKYHQELWYKKKLSDRLKGAKNPRYIRLTDKELDSLIADYKKGHLTNKQLSEKYKMSRSTIKRKLVQHDKNFLIKFQKERECHLEKAGSKIRCL